MLFPTQNTMYKAPVITPTSPQTVNSAPTVSPSLLGAAAGNPAVAPGTTFTPPAPTVSPSLLGAAAGNPAVAPGTTFTPPAPTVSPSLLGAAAGNPAVAPGTTFTPNNPITQGTPSIGPSLVGPAAGNPAVAPGTTFASNQNNPNTLPVAPQPNTTTTPVSNIPGQSLENMALGGGSNPQQISNFLQALQQVGAGGNNTFQNGGLNGQQPVQNLVNPNISNNGSVAGLNPGGGVQTAAGSNGGNPVITGNNATTNQVPPSQQMTSIGLGSQGIKDALNLQNQQTQNQQAQNANSQVNGTGSAINGLFAPQQGNPVTGSPITPTKGQPALVSDENLKTNIKSGDFQIQSFLNAINAHSYEYKNKNDGVGRFVSPMAQELEKTELGKSAVIDTPKGKMVDYARLSGVNLAASSVLYRQQEKLQNQINSLMKQFKLKGK